MNDRVDKLDDGDSLQLEATILAVHEPPPGKTARRVRLQGDPRTYYTMRAMNLVAPGTKVHLTIKASAFQDRLFLWVEEWSKIQAEELPL